LQSPLYSLGLRSGKKKVSGTLYFKRFLTPFSSPDLYAASYRPLEQKEQAELSVWQEALVVGQPLPKMPLWLRNGLCMPVELEETYEQTCRELRLVSNGTRVS
jgi:hypothetical protein